MRWWGLAAFGVALLVSGCGSDDAPLPKDGGTDTLTITCPASIHAGLACSAKGFTCPFPDAGGCDAFKSFVCNGMTFALKDDLGPGSSCTASGLSCPFPNTECGGTCTCNGTVFGCSMNCCATTCMCPGPGSVTDGTPCDTVATCPSDDPCDGGSAASCTCNAGTWSCSCTTID